MSPREPFTLEEAEKTIDPVAHYLWHTIEKIESGETIPALSGPPEMVVVRLHIVRAVLGQVLDLMESGHLALLENVEEDGGITFHLNIVGLN